MSVSPSSIPVPNAYAKAPSARRAGGRRFRQRSTLQDALPYGAKDLKDRIREAQNGPTKEARLKALDLLMDDKESLYSVAMNSPHEDSGMAAFRRLCLITDKAELYPMLAYIAISSPNPSVREASHEAYKASFEDTRFLTYPEVMLLMKCAKL